MGYGPGGTCNRCGRDGIDNCCGITPSAASAGYSPWTPPFEFTITSVFDSKGHKVFDMRGWGFLTGSGSLNLPDDEAIKIQDEMGRKIAALMNKDAGL